MNSMNDELEAPKEASIELEARPQEQLLLDQLDELYAGRVLCNTVGRAQFARAFARRHPQADVTCLIHDVHQQQLAEGVSRRRLKRGRPNSQANDRGGMHAVHASLPGAFDEHLTLSVGLDPIVVRFSNVIRYIRSGPSLSAQSSTCP